MTQGPVPGGFSISDAKNEAGEWTMSPEQIRAEMAANAELPEPDEEFVDCDEYGDEEE
jgi:hypothetical protein